MWGIRAVHHIWFHQPQNKNKDLAPGGENADKKENTKGQKTLLEKDNPNANSKGRRKLSLKKL